MVDNLASYKVFCAGGLNTSRDVLSQGETMPGSAIRLVNYEPAVTGGYRRISGYSNDYGTVPGLDKVLGVEGTSAPKTKATDSASVMKEDDEVPFDTSSAEDEDLDYFKSLAQQD